MSREDAVAPMSDYGMILRRRWQYIATIVPAIILIAVYMAFSLPTLFQATAIVMLEQSSVQAGMVTSTVTSDATRRIELVQSRVMTQAALEELVKKHDPYPTDPNLTVADKASRIIENTSFEHVDPITGRTNVESSAFQLQYMNPNPKEAATTASHLVELFLTYNVRTRVESAKETAAFLEGQTKALNLDLQQVDTQLAQLKMKYGEALPEDLPQNQSGLNMAQREVENLQREIRIEEEKENQLSLQLNQISPNLVALGGDLTDLAKVKAQLAEAEQNYTADHPDVRRLRRAMQDLLARNAAGGEKMAKPNNPEYLRIEQQLQAVRRELAALRAQAGRAGADIARFSANIRSAPGVEREVNAVNRRREALQAQFFEAQEKLRNAQLAQSFETESRGEKFRLVRAPIAPRLPASPNRIGMILLGLVLGFGLAAATVAIVESMDPTVRGSDDLPVIAGGTLLGSIPIIMTQSDRRRRMLVWSSVAGTYAVAILIVGLTVLNANA